MGQYWPGSNIYLPNGGGVFPLLMCHVCDFRHGKSSHLAELVATCDELQIPQGKLCSDSLRVCFIIVGHCDRWVVLEPCWTKNVMNSYAQSQGSCHCLHIL